MKRGDRLSLHVVVSLAAGALALPAQAQRVPAAQAQLDCRATGEDFVYDCKVQLARAGSPLAGLEVTVGADMPSMPMAHNVKPVKAKPGATPGEYHARLELEMPGVWAVKLRLGKPVNDLLVLRYTFDDQRATPEAGASRR